MNVLDIPCEYHDGKRFYVTPEGEHYKSITSILSELTKADIQKWRARVGEKEANRITQKASRRGTAVHSVCESYIKNEDGFLEGEMPHIIEVFRSIEPLLDRIDNVRLVEGALWSDELRVAGRTDLIADFDDKLAVIDYKTSNYKKTWEMCHKFFMQGAFYAHAFEERYGTPIENIIIIMAVDGSEPLLWKETTSRWIEPLKQVITKYS
jgi:genome maintenance exonuclease 1